MSRVALKARPSPDPWSLDDVQHLVLDQVSWELYEHLLKLVGDRPIRMTFDQGRLEIMSPLPQHERPKSVLGRLVEEFSLAFDLDVDNYGSTTFRKAFAKKGLEPDECFYIRHAPRVRGKKRISVPKDPPPDLAIEVDIFNRSIPRLPIYAALGVPEVWRYDGKMVSCLHLNAVGEYEAHLKSRSFPALTPNDLVRFVRLADRKGQLASVKAFRVWLRSLGRTSPGRA